MRLVKPRVFASAAAAASAPSPSDEAICAAWRRRAVGGVACQLLRLSQADQRLAAFGSSSRPSRSSASANNLRALDNFRAAIFIQHGYKRFAYS